MSVAPRPSVACLGPEGSFSHEFALAHFGVDAQITCVSGSFEDVLGKVQDGSCVHAVLPFLNSNGVEVRPVQIALGKCHEWLRVEGCFPHKVAHNVVVAEGFEVLERLVSKEQVFPQCTDWLRQWAHLEQEFATSTSAALVDLLKAGSGIQKNTGAICNLLAHQIYGGRVAYSHVENPRNTTLFLRVSALEPDPSSENLLVCLTCPTEACYKTATSDFASAGFPVKFSSLKGEFSPDLPFFLQFANVGSMPAFQEMLLKPHRHFMGAFDTKSSLSACVGAFFEDDYLDDEV